MPVKSRSHRAMGRWLKIGPWGVRIMQNAAVDSTLFWHSFGLTLRSKEHLHPQSWRVFIPKQSTCWTFHLNFAARFWIRALQLAFEVTKITIVRKSFTFGYCGACVAAIFLFYCEQWRIHQDSCQIRICLRLGKSRTLPWSHRLFANECCARSLRKCSLQICFQVTHTPIERKTIASVCCITFASAAFNGLTAWSTAGFDERLLSLVGTCDQKLEEKYLLEPGKPVTARYSYSGFWK